MVACPTRVIPSGARDRPRHASEARASLPPPTRSLAPLGMTLPTVPHSPPDRLTVRPSDRPTARPPYYAHPFRARFFATFETYVSASFTPDRLMNVVLYCQLIRPQPYDAAASTEPLVFTSAADIA